MIAILTNDGSLQIARALSGGELFLVYGAALLAAQYSGAYQVATTHYEVGVDGSGNAESINGEPVVRMIPCTGVLPVQVAEGTNSALALDFDFNTQLDRENESGMTVYQTVCMLGRRYRQYRNIEYGETYHYSDHVWLGGNASRDTAYVCIVEEYAYAKGMPDPDSDPEHWAAVREKDLVQYPGKSDYYADPAYDICVMHVTSYDEAMTMGNGIEWEYKVRVFLDNLSQSNVAAVEKFAQGTEANGSLILSFMAEISANFQALRNMVSPVA